MSVPRPTYANVIATSALVIALGGGAIAVAAGEDISGCVKKSGANVGAIRIVSDPTTCGVNEDALTWNQEGPAGPAGSPDTGQDILNKLAPIDGDGSGLDASFLDGLNSTAFLRTTGKAADADKLDGKNSTAFADQGSSSAGTIGLSAIGANTCKDVTFGIAGLQAHDSVILTLNDDTLPANLIMSPLSVTAPGQLKVRVCNPTNTASVADGDIKVRWNTLKP